MEWRWGGGGGGGRDMRTVYNNELLLGAASLPISLLLLYPSITVLHAT